jgi:hypothetical protein
MQHAVIDAGQAAVWQTGTAVVQAVVSITLLGWYVLAAHMDRARMRREKLEDFDSLVRLCRDLGAEAGEKTQSHGAMLSKALADSSSDVDVARSLAAWQRDMTVAYVCLNEVPHYEVRNPAFSTALTRLWLAVDSRTAPADRLSDARALAAFFQDKFDQICLEVDAMANLLSEDAKRRRGKLNPLGPRSDRRGYAYDPDGFPQKD